MLHVRVVDVTDGDINACRCGITGGGEGANIGDQRERLLFPFRTAAVKNARVGEAEQFEHPEGIRGPPVALVTVQHDGRAGINTARAEQFLKLRRRHLIALYALIEIRVPIDFQCVEHVAWVIEANVLVPFK